MLHIALDRTFNIHKMPIVLDEVLQMIKNLSYLENKRWFFYGNSVMIPLKTFIFKNVGP